MDLRVSLSTAYIWKTAPFIRLLIPYALGIILEHYMQFKPKTITILVIAALLLYLVYRLLPLVLRYKLRFVPGIAIFISLGCIGAFSLWQNDIRHQSNWFGNYYQPGDRLLIRIDDLPSE